jgi:hypothetical protein
MTTTVGQDRIENLDRGPLDRGELAAVIARDIPAGSYVNPGIGQPTLVADHLRPESGVVLHTENGMLGMGGHRRGGRPRSDQRRKDPGHRNAWRVLLSPCGLVRDDARRSPRRVRPRRVSGE